ncbi:MAG: tetratricopeptide repeat protein [Candidatus Omnitrophica bacterium]|nr:tetratricopeptide repeat protein [Candidatus Omnitrophota bacterium]
MMNKIFFWFMIIVSMVVCVPSYAALDIFDHPKEVARKKEVRQMENELRLLDYPKECILKGNYEEAYESCQKLMSYPSARKVKGEILYLSGLCSLKLGRFLEARSYFNDVILMGKNNLKIDAYLGIADSYFQGGKFDKAFDSYKQTLKECDTGGVEGIVYYKLGETSYKMGRAEDAKYYFDKVIKEFPFSFEARLSSNFLYKNASSFTEAAKSDFYSIQVGCFNEKDNADKICEKLVKDGFAVYILESQGSEGPRYHVKVGRLNSREEAMALETRLKRTGYPTKICP